MAIPHRYGQAGWDFPFQRPLLPPPSAWRDDLAEAYDARWFSNHGALARRLEAALARRCARSVVLANNGTSAITAALMALGLAPGAAVVLPAFTFPATLCAVEQAGLTPVLADVDAHSWELSVECVEAACRGRGDIGAVLAVRVFGLCRDFSALQGWCDARGLPLLIDAAAALGGELDDGRPVGAQGAMETFSLHATKVFAIGEGGAIACDPARVDVLRRVMNFGLEGGDVTSAGFNGKLSEFAAAVGLAQDRVFDAQLALRRAAAQAYAGFFAERHRGWGLAQTPGRPPWQAFPLLAPDAGAADALEGALARAGVQLRRYYRPALHLTRAAARYAARPLEQAGDLAARMVCLPMYSDWRDGELGALFDRLDDALRQLPTP